MIFIIIFVFQLLVLFSLSQFLLKSLSKLVFFLTKNEALTVNLMHFLFLPGIIIHELSHFLSALLLLVRIEEVDFFPKYAISQEEKSMRFGGVSIVKTDPVRRALIGLAPLVFGTVLLIFLFFFFVSYNGLSPFWRSIIILFMTFEVGNTMFSSHKDLEGTLELSIAALIVFFSFYLLGVHFFNLSLQFSLSEKTIQLIKQANLVLFIPIMLDILIIGAVRIIRKTQKM